MIAEIGRSIPGWLWVAGIAALLVLASTYKK